MCLTVVEVGTRRKSSFYVYKVFRNTGKTLMAPIQKTRYKIGENKVEDLETNISEWSSVYRAIHAFTTKKDANDYFYVKDDRILLKLKVHPRDVIATGSGGEIALSKLTIPEKMYKKALKRKKWGVVE